ncbi:MAG: outer membrane lipoprotein LolB [Gammaproteobacteria bacterium]|nr:outer membrane lipoprotein LolB [Gammaproteobacteria bacterium]
MTKSAVALKPTLAQTASPYILTFVLSLLLCSCALQPALTSVSTDRNKLLLWQERTAQLNEIRSWKLNGRIAIQKEKESGSASLKWRQQGEGFEIDIIGPFGKGTVELRGDDSGVSMQDAEGLTLRAADAETLLQKYLGWQVPVSGLHYWIRGLPSPKTTVETMLLDEQSRLSELTQFGWKVTYKRYQTHREQQLPAKMELLNEKLKVKLVLREWELP